MAYGTYESSRQNGQPVSLYLFRFGTGPTDYYAYTDAEKPITHTNPIDGAVVYQPTPIDRSDINTSNSLDKSELTIRVQKLIPLNDLYTVYPPSSVVTVTLREGHPADPAMDFPVAWAGTVLTRIVNGAVSEFKCQPMTSGLRRNGLRRNYQLGCPHVLYGAQCKANKAAATTTHTVVDVGGTFVDMASGWNGSIAVEKYVGGLLSWVTSSGTELRTILRVETGTRIHVSGTIRNLLPAGTVSTILGCNHQMSDCGALHNNIQNYGGQPFIPLKNPFSFVSPFV